MKKQILTRRFTGCSSHRSSVDAKKARCRRSAKQQRWSADDRLLPESWPRVENFTIDAAAGV